MIVLTALEATFGLPLPIFPTMLMLAFRPATPSFVAPFKDLDAVLNSAPVAVSTTVTTVASTPAYLENGFRCCFYKDIQNNFRTYS